MAAVENVFSDLQEDLLECVFKSLNGDNRTFSFVSVASKQFLSITNRVRFSATITDSTIPYLPRLFHRFPNLTSLNLILLSKTLEEVDDILTLISTFPLHIKSLHLANNKLIPFPANGLIALSKTMKNLTSLTFYRLFHYAKKDLFLLADCFPLLEELNLTYPRVRCGEDFFIDDKDPLLALPNLHKINLSGNLIDDPFIQFLRHSCKLLQLIVIIDRIISGNPEEFEEFGENGIYDRSDIIHL